MEHNVSTSSEFQAALAAAASNGGDDTIFLSAGTYYGNFKFTAGEAKALTIKPALGAAAGSVILDGQQKGYILLMDGSGLDVNFVLEGLTIQNGNSQESGGGIYAKQAGNTGTFVVLNCNIKDNHALQNGGGCFFGSFNLVTIDGSIISDNFGSIYGGGVCCSGPSAFTNNIISNNSSGNSGGVHCSGPGTFTNNTISNNSTSGSGGGIFLDGSTGTFTNNTINNNSAHTWNGGGGGVFLSESTGTFTNNTISNNYSFFQGGGVFLSVSTGTFTNNTISNNSLNPLAAVDINLGGGGLCIAYSAGTFTNNIISNNSADYGGGLKIDNASGTFTNNTINFNANYGIYWVPGTNNLVNIYNNIIWGNKVSGNDGDVYMAGYGQESNFFNNIYTSAFAIWHNEGDNQIVDPMFHDPASGDFHVDESSAAINAGLNTAPNIPTTDLDGNPRILDSVVDIGAYERSTTALHPADLNGNWIIESTEFTSYNAAWRANTAWQNEPNPVPINFVTRAGYLLQKGGSYKNIGVGKPGTWVPDN